MKIALTFLGALLFGQMILAQFIILTDRANRATILPWIVLLLVGAVGGWVAVMAVCLA